MTVCVTQQHIDEARRRTIESAFHNPVTFALRDFDRFAVVTRNRIHLSAHGTFAPPPFIVAWLRAYFNGIPVNPITFDLVGVSR